MQRYHFRPYSPNQTILFPQRIDKDIAESDPVRLISSIVESLDLSNFRRLYKERGRSPYNPKMLLKVVIYAYMNNIYSCRRIEQALKRDIHFIWLAAYEQPDFITINRFRNRVKDEINNVFTQLVLLLSAKGLVSLDVEYIDGTKIESKANKYTFVWRKTVEKNRAKLMEKIKVLLAQVDDAIAQDKAADKETVSFTPETLTEIADELRQSLSEQPAPRNKEEKEVVREKKKQVKQLEKMRDKLSEYNNHLETLGERNSYSKSDPDATFMRMKEDAMNNGQTKPGYNLQIATENQFITDFGFFHNPNDTGTMIPFLNSFSDRYGHFAKEACADSGYGSEENYSFMEAHEMKAYVKYNFFHKEQKRAFKNDIFRIENLYYNPEGDYFVCPMGQHMERVGVSHGKTDSGYRTESVVYRAGDCQGCPLRWGCYKKRKGNREIEVNHRLMEYKRKVRERLTSERGLKHRSNRPIEPEAVFGQMKYNMHYKRFRHFGKDKVTMDFAFFAIAFNIKKMAAKVLKQGNMPTNGRRYMPLTSSYT
ncbi:MAG: IS1182 family transposase, partial [Prevotella sp.]|nr:IS1182 family transposase [Prevotella sp.]